MTHTSLSMSTADLISETFCTLTVQNTHFHCSINFREPQRSQWPALQNNK